VAAEFLRGILLGGFPWNGIGVTLAQNPTLIQIASIGGVLAVSALVVLANAAIASMIERTVAPVARAWTGQPSEARPRRSLTPSLETLVPKLFDLPTLRTHQMLVMRYVARRLKPTEPFAKVALHEEPALEQGVDRSIHRRRADGPPTRTHFTRDFFGGEMMFRVEQYLGDREPLRRDGQVVLAKVRREALDYGVVCQCFSAAASIDRTVSPSSFSGSRGSLAR
jgi:hypothetical protein